MHSESDLGDDADAAAAVVVEGVAMVRAPEPSIEGAEVVDGLHAWGQAGLAERLIAAGAVPAAADVAIVGDAARPSPGEARTNPPGYVWRLP